MILYRNNLFFGAIRHFFRVIFGTICKVIEFFNLLPTALLLLVGLILYFCGVFENGIVLLIYQILIILSVVFSIIGSIKHLLGLDKKNRKKVIKKSKGAEILNSQVYYKGEVSEETDNTEESDDENPGNCDSENSERQKGNNFGGEKSKSQSSENIRPLYYRVKQNPNFIMAEYPDRYELYKVTEKGLVKIRTDRR